MSGPGISDDDELTVESLQRDKSELFSGTVLGDAIDKIEDEKHEELIRHQQIVEAKVTLAAAEREGVDDPAVEALRSTVEDLSEETEAAALVEHAEEVEAREKISELEALTNSTEGKTSASFEQKAEALRSKHGLEDEPGRYDVEALADTEDDIDEAAEALAEFREKKEATVADEDLPEEAKARLADFKQMREQASTPALRQLYENKIEALREEHT